VTHRGPGHHAYRHGRRVTRPSWGIACPECDDLHSRVLDTRQRQKRMIYRRRECPNGHRYSTLEGVAESRKRNLGVGHRKDIADRLDEVLGGTS